MTSLGTLFGLFDYPTEVENKGEKITKTALQHLENNDDFIFICKFETISNYEEFYRLSKETNLDHWNKLQPYLIGLFIAKGIPMLWQGQEFGDNYWVPKKGQGRVLFVQTCALEYFYTLEDK